MDDIVKRYRERRDARVRARCDAEFNESDHPRAKDGKFTSGAGGSAESKPESKTRKKVAGFKDHSAEYKQLLERNQKNAERNSNNLMYKDLVEQFKGLSDAAERINKNGVPEDADGWDAVAAMHGLPNGSTVEIKGNVFEGTYKKDRIKDPLSGQMGDCWVQQGVKRPHAFAANTSTIASEIGAKRKKSKVSFK